MVEFTKSLEIIETASGNNGFSVDIVAYKSLDGGLNIETATSLYMAREAGMRLKHVRISLNDSSATLESGALYFMKGNIDASATVGGSGGFRGLARGLATKLLSDETMMRPSYSGTGELYLEPSFAHYLVWKLEKNESLIVDKGMYFCSEGSIGVTVASQKNISAGIAGDEGWFQTKVVGPGICVFASPIPRNEILCYELKNEKLQVDGNFALMRTEGIDFSVQKSTRSIMGSMVSGEGLLQTFEGTGKVWIAPTQPVYKNLAKPSDFSKFADHRGSSHTST